MMNEQGSRERGEDMSSRIRRAAGYEREAEAPADEASEPAGPVDFDGGPRTTPPRPASVSDLIRRAAGF